MSIIIVTYNSLHDIEPCLRSVEVHTGLPHEVIIVDNISSDGTREYLKTLKRHKVILNDENLGFARACNQGIAESNADYIVLLNPDTIVTRDWAWRMMLHFRNGIGAVGPVSNHAAGLQHYEFYRQGNLGADHDIGLIAENYYQWNKNHSVETRLLIGFCLMIKRNTIDKAGLLDEDLFLGSEDLEYSWRLRQKGFRLMVASDVFIHHTSQASFSTVLPEVHRRLTQDGQDKLYSKLEAYYGPGCVPSSIELWGMDWFRPAQINKPKLTSIIILTFNQIQYTRQCLESIEEFTTMPHEIIIVDNGSTDGTRDFLRAYQSGHENCEIILNDSNRGFAGGNNQGLEKAKGDYILLLNNDVVVTENWLERLMAHMEPYPNRGMAGPMTNYVSGRQLVEKVPYDTDIGRMHAFAREHALKHAGQTSYVMRLVGFCLLIRKEVLDLIGGLDENYGSGNFEDDDLCLRSVCCGYRNIIAHDCFVHHFGSMTFKGNSIDYTQTMDKNKKYFFSKWGHLIKEVKQGYELSITNENMHLFIDEVIRWGEEQFEKGNTVRSANLFKRALKIQPGNPRAVNDLGVILWQTGNVPDAIKIFIDALTSNPENADAFSNLVASVKESGRYDLVDRTVLEKLQPIYGATDGFSHLSQPHPGHSSPSG